MRNIKLVIQYDGTKYIGWQKQGNTARTIQGKIESVLAKMTGEEIELHGLGRTDAGVHAFGQVANFFSSTTMSAEQIQIYMNRYLPEDIAVVDVQEAEERFHARLHAIGKTYRYRIWNMPYMGVFVRKYVYVPEQVLDEDKITRMKKAAVYLEGTHDFKSFCSNKRIKKSTVRTIHQIQFSEKNGELYIDITGNGFLYNMVRIIVGTLLEVADGSREPEEIQQILLAKDRQAAGMTAPPQGLCLMQVEYNE